MIVFLVLLASKMIFLSLVLAFLWCMLHVSPVSAARDSDEVSYVPHLNGPQPTFKHYAGYLNATGQRKLFYWFVQSEGSPANDPVVLWLNGGPGCSSLIGFLRALGPFQANENETTVSWRFHRWNKLANMIFMEAPVGVGFSYSEDGNWTSSDNSTADDNHAALVDFFNLFPEFQSNPLYLTGQSHAGIFVPTLALLLSNDQRFNLKGFAVGNPITTFHHLLGGYAAFTYSRGMLGNNLTMDIMQNCCKDNNVTNCVFIETDNPDCLLLQARLMSMLWDEGLNPYNLYKPCFGGVPDSRGVFHETEEELEVMLKEPLLLPPDDIQVYEKAFRDLVHSHDRPLARTPCTDLTHIENYLNRPEVRRALHVPESVQYWVPCSAMVSANYTRDYYDMTDTYHSVLSKGLRALVYSGDLDQACTHLANYNFVKDLGRAKLSDYKTWQYNTTDRYGPIAQIAGWAAQFENITALQIKGAGHTAPMDQPGAAFEMWRKFLSDEAF